MKEKIGLFILVLCVSIIIVFFCVGSILLFHVIIDGIVAALGPWWICGLLLGVAIALSIVNYRKLVVEEYPELAKQRRYYISNYDEFMRDSHGRVLEFQTKESATVFLDKMSDYVDTSMGYGVIAHLVLSEEVVDATDMTPSMVFNGEV